MGPNKNNYRQVTSFTNCLSQINLVVKLRQVPLVHLSCNPSSQLLELSRFWGVVISSRETRCTRNGANTIKVQFTISSHNNNCLPFGQQCQCFISFLFNVLQTCNWLFKLGTTTLSQHQCSFQLVNQFAVLNVLLFTSQFQRLWAGNESINKLWMYMQYGADRLTFLSATLSLPFAMLACRPSI